MKKLISSLLVVVMMLALSVPAFASGHGQRHPQVPEQSLQNISRNAANGMHTAWGNIQDANGIASHVFTFRFSPH